MISFTEHWLVVNVSIDLKCSSFVACNAVVAMGSQILSLKFKMTDSRHLENQNDNSRWFYQL